MWGRRAKLGRRGLWRIAASPLPAVRSPLNIAKTVDNKWLVRMILADDNTLDSLHTLSSCSEPLRCPIL